MENKNMERKTKYTFNLDYKKMWESATDKALTLQEENKVLKENSEHNDKVVDKVNWENMLLKKENKKQKEVIDEARQCIKEFLCSEEYINVDGDAIANNYENILDILKEVPK